MKRRPSYQLGIALLLLSGFLFLPGMAFAENGGKAKGVSSEERGATTQQPALSSAFIDLPASQNSTQSIAGDRFQLDGTADYFYDLHGNAACILTIIGDDEDDRFGIAMVRGDVNNDGLEDVIVGASFADGPSNSRFDAGEVYVFYGNANPMGDTILASNADVVMYGIDSEDFAGDAVACGDINGDLIADIIIGAPSADGRNNGTNYTGEAYVIFGGESLPPVIELASGANVTIYGLTTSPGSSANQTGHAVDVGDIDNDDINDLIIYAPGGDDPNGAVDDLSLIHI